MTIYMPDWRPPSGVCWGANSAHIPVYCSGVANTKSDVRHQDQKCVSIKEERHVRGIAPCAQAARGCTRIPLLPFHRLLILFRAHYLTMIFSGLGKLIPPHAVFTGPWRASIEVATHGATRGILHNLALCVTKPSPAPRCSFLTRARCCCCPPLVAQTARSSGNLFLQGWRDCALPDAAPKNCGGAVRWHSGQAQLAELTSHG